MNKIYKVIWSKVKHQYVVVSELAHSNGKQSRTSRNSIRSRIAALVVCGAIAAFGVYGALPVQQAFAAEGDETVSTSTAPTGGPANITDYVVYRAPAGSDPDTPPNGYEPVYPDQEKYPEHSSELYWVKTGFSVDFGNIEKLDGNGSAFGVTNIYTENKDLFKESLTNTVSLNKGTDEFTNIGDELNDVSLGNLVSSTNAAGSAAADVPREYHYYIQTSEGNWVNVGNTPDNGTPLDTYFKTADENGSSGLKYDSDTGRYIYTKPGTTVGQVVSSDNIYCIGGEVGVFVDNDENLYTGTVWGNTGEILTTVKDGDNYVSFWSALADSNDIYLQDGNVTVGDINNSFGKLIENDKILRDNDIKEITVAQNDKGGTIGLIRNGADDEGNSAVDGTISIEGVGGTSGKDTGIKFSQKDADGRDIEGFTINTGSRVEGTGSDPSGTLVYQGSLTGLTINGQYYTVPKVTVSEDDDTVNIKEGNTTNIDLITTSGEKHIATSGDTDPDNESKPYTGVYTADADGIVKLTEVDGTGKATENTLQIKDVASKTALDKLDDLAVKYDDKNKDEITLGGLGEDGEPSKDPVAIHNVADGVDLNDAVNVSQLKKVETLAGKHTTMTVNGGTPAPDVPEGETESDYTDGNLQLKQTNNGGKIQYDVKLNDRIELGTAPAEGTADKRVVVDGNTATVSIGGIDITNENGPYLAVGDGKLKFYKDGGLATGNETGTFSVRPDGDLEISGKNSSFDVDAETGNVNAINSSGSAIMMNDDSVALNASGNGVAISDEGITLNTNGSAVTVDRFNGATFTNTNTTESTNINGATITTGTVKGLKNTTTNYEGFATEGKAATEEQLQQAAAASKTTLSNGINTNVTSKTDPIDGHVDYQVNLNDNINLNNRVYINGKPAEGNNTIVDIKSGDTSKEESIFAVEDKGNGSISIGGIDVTNVDGPYLAVGDDKLKFYKDGGLATGNETGTFSVRPDGDLEISGKNSSFDVDAETGNVNAINSSGSAIMMNDDSVALNASGNGVAISDEGITLNTNGSAVTVDRFNGATFTNTNTTESTNINGATITTGTVKGLKNTTTNYEGFATEGKAATEEQLQQAAAASKTTLSNGINTNVTSKTDPIDGHVDYQVNLNDNVTLGTGDNQISINGAPKANDPALSIGNKFVVEQNGTTTIIADDGINNRPSQAQLTPDTTVTIAPSGVTFAGDDKGTTIIEGQKITAGGIVINGEDVYDKTTGIVTKGTITGLSNTTWDGTTDDISRAATEGQLKTVSDTVNAGWIATDSQNNEVNITPDNNKLNFAGDENVTVTAANNEIKVALKDDIVLGDYLNGDDGVLIGGSSGTISATNSITVGEDQGLIIDGQKKEIQGLSNTTWNEKIANDAAVEGSTAASTAATQGQLQQATSTLTTNERHIATNGGDNPEAPNNKYTVQADGTVSLTEVNGDGTPTKNTVVLDNVATKTQQDINTDKLTHIEHYAVDDEGNTEGKDYTQVEGTKLYNDGSISSTVKDGFLGMSSDTLTFDESGLTVSKETMGNGSGSTNISGDTIKTVDEYGNETTIDGGSVTTEDLTVNTENGNKLTFDSTGLNVNSGDTGLSVNKDGISLSVDNGAGKNSSVKVTQDGTEFSYSENGIADATTTTIKGSTITTDTVTGLNNTTWDDELAKQVANSEELQGTAATQGQLQQAVSEVAEVANAGWTASDGTNSISVKPNETLTFVGDENLTVSADGTDKELKVSLNDDITLGDGENAIKIDGTNGTLNIGNTFAVAEDGTVLSDGDVIADADGEKYSLSEVGKYAVRYDKTNDGTSTITLVDGDDLSGTRIKNVADGVDPKDAVNVSQLEAVEATANAGWTASDGTNSISVKPNETLTFVGDENLTVSADGTDKKLKVSLNDNITLGDGQSAITLNGSPQNSDDPALSVGTDKFVVAQDGSLSVSDKFNVDAETGNIYAANNSGSAIMMNDDSVALNAGGNGIVASDEGILLNTNGINEDIKLVTKGTSVSVDSNGTTFTNTNTNETTNINGGTINVGDKLMVEEDGSIYATNNNGSTVMINDNGVALNSEGNGVVVSGEGITLNTNGSAVTVDRFNGTTFTNTNTNETTNINGGTINVGDKLMVEEDGSIYATNNNGSTVMINDNGVALNSEGNGVVVSGEGITLNTNGSAVTVDRFNGTTFTNTNTGETTNINGGTITTNTVKGLSNTTWDDELAKQVANSEELQGTAATQGQLQQAVSEVAEVANAGWNAKAGGNTINVKPNETLNFEGDGNITVSATGGTSNELKFGLNDDITLGNPKAGNTEGERSFTINTTNPEGYVPDSYKEENSSGAEFIKENGGFMLFATDTQGHGIFGVTAKGSAWAKDFKTYTTDIYGNNTQYSLNDVGDAVAQMSSYYNKENGKSYTVFSRYLNEAEKDNPFATVDENATRDIPLALRDDGAVLIGATIKGDDFTDNGIRINAETETTYDGDGNEVTNNIATITGLENTEWKPPTPVATFAANDINTTSRAATEAQLDDLYSAVAAYDVNVDGTIDYSHIALAGAPYGASRAGNGTPTGGTSITNVAYASGKDGSEAVNVDYLNDAISDAAENGSISTSDQHLVANTETGSNGVYKPNDDGNVNLIVSDEKGNSSTITIGDVASKTELDSLKTNVGDLSYSKVQGDDVKDGDSITTAIGKLDNKIENISGTATDADNNTVTGGKINSDGTISLTQKDKDSIKLEGQLTDSGVVQEGTSFDKETGTITITSQDKYSGETSSVKVEGIASTEVVGATNKEDLATAYKDADKDGNATTEYITDSESMVEADVALDHAIQDVANTSYANDMVLSNRIDSVEKRLGNVEERIDKVGAMAAAIANLRTMGFDPEAPTEIAIGVGQYKSETGIAIGVFHYPNQDFMLSASLSSSGDELMGGIGATWKLGRKSAAERAKDEEARHLEQAEEMKKLAQQEKVKAQAQRHAKLLAERQQASQKNA